MDRKSNPGSKMCEAMLAAGITDPESQEGINFCVNKCPYNKCIVFEGKRPRAGAKRISELKESVKFLRDNRVSHKQIAITLGINIYSVRRYLYRK